MNLHVEKKKRPCAHCQRLRKKTGTTLTFGACRIPFAYHRVGKVIPHKKWTKADQKKARARYMELLKMMAARERKEKARLEAMWKRIAKKKKTKN